jgi:hypothetical protein
MTTGKNPNVIGDPNIAYMLMMLGFSASSLSFTWAPFLALSVPFHLVLPFKRYPSTMRALRSLARSVHCRNQGSFTGNADG